MVCRLLLINHVDQVCDNCLVRKWWHLLFPFEAKNCIENKLELVHEDICGPVMSATPSGNNLIRGSPQLVDIWCR
jgi:hypothetical protein